MYKRQIYKLAVIPPFCLWLYGVFEFDEIPMLIVAVFDTAVSFVALALTFRDLYLRQFDTPSAKLKWLLIIFYTLGIGWLIYVFRYALEPRSDLEGSN